MDNGSLLTFGAVCDQFLGQKPVCDREKQANWLVFVDQKPVCDQKTLHLVLWI